MAGPKASLLLILLHQASPLLLKFQHVTLFGAIWDFWKTDQQFHLIPRFHVPGKSLVRLRRYTTATNPVATPSPWNTHTPPLCLTLSWRRLARNAAAKHNK
jgi:hypothetical protein